MSPSYEDDKGEGGEGGKTPLQGREVGHQLDREEVR